MVVVGGAHEAVQTQVNGHDLVLKKRRGFFRVALNHGCLLVPVSLPYFICFSSNSFYSLCRLLNFSSCWVFSSSINLYPCGSILTSNLLIVYYLTFVTILFISHKSLFRSTVSERITSIMLLSHPDGKQAFLISLNSIWDFLCRSSLGGESSRRGSEWSRRVILWT